jgi:hypothetical protein
VDSISDLEPMQAAVDRIVVINKKISDQLAAEKKTLSSLRATHQLSQLLIQRLMLVNCKSDYMHSVLGIIPAENIHWNKLIQSSSHLL